MMTILSCLTVQHDARLVLLAALVCAFGSWVTARLFSQTSNRPRDKALPWSLLAASTAGVTIWGTHFVAMLGFRPEVPVSFDLTLTLLSLLIAVLGSVAGILFAAMIPLRLAPAIGGAIFGLAISAMHYSGMIAYRVRGLVEWQEPYLALSIVLGVSLSALALMQGRRGGRDGTWRMAGVMTLAIVALHFTGMAAFQILPLDIAGDYVNPSALGTLALAVAGIAILIMLGALFSFALERTRMANIAELTEARNAAERASRIKSEFMSVLSHELRTPLTIVMGYSTILAQLKDVEAKRVAGGAAPLPLEQQLARVVGQAETYGQKINASAQHLLTLINEILDYSSFELGDGTITPERFDVGGLLAEVEDQFQGLAAQKQIALHVACDQITAMADRRRCLQILINLVGNAVKFSRSPIIILRAKYERGGFSLIVEDQGRGIAEKDLERIFVAFQQLENADSRSEGGTGLGLAICRKIAAAHGGEISVKSRLGEGTVFTVWLPESALAEPPPPTQSRRTAAPSRLSAAPATRTMLRLAY
ncbi:MHYT domain-containing protein [Frigidibacter sp. MR17.14]|uniref:MHYT domain-containing protein n=1 Tax=Frigidibacter sp. MR17.14 TaxID=3126509 RepID=UPI003012D25A